jgi:hypothetical protein
MIIKQLNITRASVLESKNDPPVGAHGNSPESFAAAFQGMQAIAGKIESLSESAASSVAKMFSILLARSDPILLRSPRS